MDFKNGALIVALSTGLLAGCGGSGGSDGDSFASAYTGETGAASLTTDNQSEFAESSVAVSKTLVSGNTDVSLDDIPFAASIETNTLSASELKRLTETLAQIIPKSNLPVAVTFSEPGDDTCDAPGSIDFSGTETNGTSVFNSYCSYETVINGTMSLKMSGDTVTSTFNNFSIDYGDGNVMTLSGAMRVKTTSSQEVTEANMTVSFGGDEFSLDFTQSCSITTDQDGFIEYGECSYSEAFIADNGVTYRVDDASISEDGNGAFDITATYFDPDYGYIDYEATDLTLCEDGSFESGTIVLMDEASQMLTVTFNGCGQDFTATLSAIQ